MSRKLTLELTLDNAAFDDNERAEAARILRRAADQVECDWDSSTLHDINGNRVGRWMIEGERLGDPDDDEPPEDPDCVHRDDGRGRCIDCNKFL